MQPSLRSGTSLLLLVSSLLGCSEQTLNATEDPATASGGSKATGGTGGSPSPVGTGGSGAKPNPIVSEPVVLPPGVDFLARPASRALPPGTTTVLLTVKTREAADVRLDTADSAFPQMTVKATSAADNTYTFTLPLEVDRPYTFYVKAAPSATPNAAWPGVQKVNYRVLRDYNPPYPRLFTLWGPAYYLPTDQQGEPATAESISKLSVFIHNFHGEMPLDAAMFPAARKLNPNVKILTQLYSTYGCHTTYCAELDAVDEDASKPATYHKSFVRNADKSPWLYGTARVYNFANPATVSYFVEKNAALWREDLLLFDGAFMHNAWRGFRWVSPGDPDTIDLDGDGKADDPRTRDRAYEFGEQSFLKALRAQMPNAILMGNATGGFPTKFDLWDTDTPLTDEQGKPFSYLDAVDGVEFEDDIGALGRGVYWREFAEFMSKYRAWTQTRWPITLVPFKLPDNATTPSDAYKTTRRCALG